MSQIFSARIASTAVASLVVLCLFPGAAGAATINVTTTADNKPADPDNGLCSLREAIEAANDNNDSGEAACEDGDGATDMILLPAGTYGLSGTVGEQLNAGGDLDVQADIANAPVVIDGAGSGSTFIDANDIERAIHVSSVPISFRLRDVTVRDGLEPSGDGGGILIGTGADATIDASVITSNASATGSGGGLRHAGGVGSSLAITGSTISSNETQAGDGGGGLSSAALEVTITNSSVTQNKVLNAATATGGGGLAVGGATATIQGSTVAGNTFSGAGSPKSGAGALLGSGTSNSVIDSRVTGNSGATVGGGLSFTGPGSVTNSLIADNSAAQTGGGIRTTDPLTVTGAVISGNTVTTADGNEAVGGGINLPSGAISGSVIADNTASTTGGVGGAARGGGIYHLTGGTIDIVRSAVVGNRVLSSASTAFGGGVAADFADTNVSNSTISGNTASGTPGSDGGGLYINSSTSVIRHVTIAENTAGTGAEGLQSAGGTVSVGSSILDSATPGSTCVGGFTDLGENMDSGTSCGLGAADENLDAGLLPVEGNGGALAGPTGAKQELPTHALPAGSVAVNRVAPASCLDHAAMPLTVDQRGFPRPFPAGGACDTGAYEQNQVCLGQGATILGGSASQTLGGTAGGDVIAAGAGNDTIDAGGGNDRICGGAGTDTASFAAGGRVTATTTAASGQGSDQLAEIENLRGSAFADRLTGNASANALFGLAGKDRLLGRAGNDRLLGQAGNDRLIGGGGRDRLIGGKGKRDRCNGGPKRDRARGCERRTRVP